MLIGQAWPYRHIRCTLSVSDPLDSTWPMVKDGDFSGYFWKRSIYFFELYSSPEVIFMKWTWYIQTENNFCDIQKMKKSEWLKNLGNDALTLHVPLKSDSYLVHFPVCVHSFPTYFLCHFQLHLLHYCPPTFLLASSPSVFLNAVHTFSRYMSSLNSS